MPTICIDPGHGGRDPGALSKTGQREKDLALAISLQLRDVLQGCGFIVIMTRDKDEALGGTVDADLQRRCNVANNSSVDVFLSIHCNAGGGRGSEIYVYQDGGKIRPLAESVVNAVAIIMGIHGQPVKDGSAFKVIRDTNMPSLLLEVGYMDSDDIDKLTANLDKFAPLICGAFMSFYGIKMPEPVKSAGVSDWAAAAFQKAIDNKVIKGDGSGNYDPQGLVTREQLAVILDNLGLLK